MTEPDVIEAMTSFQEISLSATALYMTILSGYLIVAYVAGKDLTKPQLIIVNGLFLVSSAMVSFGSVIYTQLTASYAFQLEQLITGVCAAEMGAPILPTIWACVLALGILSAFYFMWSVRKS